MAEFVRSEDAGYRPGKLLLDLTNGDHISVYKIGRKWIEALVSNGVCRSSTSRNTRGEALNSAAYTLAARILDAESCWDKLNTQRQNQPSA